MVISKATAIIVPNLEKANDFADVNNNLAKNQYAILLSYLSTHPEVSAPLSARPSSRKLKRLTESQLIELFSDVCDEIQRVERSSAEPFLAPLEQYSPKRNQARRKLSELGDSRMGELVCSLKMEVECRFDLSLEDKDNEEEEDEDDEIFNRSVESFASIPELSNSVYQLESNFSASGLSSTGMLTTPKTLSSPPSLPVIMSSPVNANGCKKDELALEEGQQPKGSTIHRVGSNFDLLDSLLQDLNVMIGKEQHIEKDELRSKYEQEILKVKSYAKHLEANIIPGKNSEIARLTTCIEKLETKLSLNMLKLEEFGEREHRMNQSFTEQSQLFNSLQAAHLQLQSQMAESLVLTWDLLKSSSKKDHTSSMDQSTIEPGTFHGIGEALFDGAIKQLENPEKTIIERLSTIKDVCSFCRKVIRAAEAAIADMDHNNNAKLDRAILAKTTCMQALSYCVVCCKDFGGKVQNEKEIRDSLTSLYRNSRALVDAMEGLLSSTESVVVNDPMAKIDEMQEGVEMLRDYIEACQEQGTYPIIISPTLLATMEDAHAASLQLCNNFIGKSQEIDENSKSVKRSFENLLTTLSKQKLNVDESEGILDQCHEIETCLQTLKRLL